MVMPNDVDSNFRIVDCKYVYNLATSSLLGAGTYRIDVLIGSTTVTGVIFNQGLLGLGKSRKGIHPS